MVAEIGQVEIEVVTAAVADRAMARRTEVAGAPGARAMVADAVQVKIEGVAEAIAERAMIARGGG